MILPACEHHLFYQKSMHEVQAVALSLSVQEILDHSDESFCTHPNKECALDYLREVRTKMFETTPTIVSCIKEVEHKTTVSACLKKQMNKVSLLLISCVCCHSHYLS